MIYLLAAICSAPLNPLPLSFRLASVWTHVAPVVVATTISVTCYCLLQEYAQVPLVKHMMEHPEFRERLEWIKQAKKLQVSR